MSNSNRAVRQLELLLSLSKSPIPKYEPVMKISTVYYLRRGGSIEVKVVPHKKREI